MNCKHAAVAIVTVFLIACATKSEKPRGPGAQERQNKGNSEMSNQKEVSAADDVIRDSGILDLSNFAATEEPDWMNPNKPPALKRQFVMVSTG